MTQTCMCVNVCIGLFVTFLGHLAQGWLGSITYKFTDRSEVSHDITFKDYRKSGGEEKALENVTVQLNVILTASFLEVHLRLFELSFL